MAIDPKQASLTFTKANLSGPDSAEKHMFDCMKEVTHCIKVKQACWCKWHSAECYPHTKSGPETPLILVCGFPCSPYSSQRGDRSVRG